MMKPKNPFLVFVSLRQNLKRIALLLQQCTLWAVLDQPNAGIQECIIVNRNRMAGIEILIREFRYAKRASGEMKCGENESNTQSKNGNNN